MNFPFRKSGEKDYNIVSAQTYENLLTDANNFIKVKAVDTPQTIYLLNQAKGKRSLREFAAVSSHKRGINLPDSERDHDRDGE
jgi:hypothetical protein